MFRTEKKYAVCENHGVFLQDVLFIFDNPRYRMCPKCVEEKKIAEDEKRIKKEKQEKQREIERLLSVSGIPDIFKDASFKKYETNEKNIEIVEFAKKYVVDFKSNNGESIVFHGETGVGKSMLSCVIANNLIARCNTVLFITLSDIFKQIKETWKKNSELSESDVINSFLSVDLLIIDEVGLKQLRENDDALLFDVIDGRILKRKPFIITTNKSPDLLFKFVGDRIASRIIGVCKGRIIGFDGVSDYRINGE